MTARNLLDYCFQPAKNIKSKYKPSQSIISVQCILFQRVVYFCFQTRYFSPSIFAESSGIGYAWCGRLANLVFIWTIVNFSYSFSQTGLAKWPFSRQIQCQWYKNGQWSSVKQKVEGTIELNWTHENKIYKWSTTKAKFDSVNHESQWIWIRPNLNSEERFLCSYCLQCIKPHFCTEQKTTHSHSVSLLLLHH